MRLSRIFRPAAPRSVWQNLGWTAGQSAAIWGLALFALPAALVALERRAGGRGFALRGQHTLGAATFAAFSALNLTTGAVLAVRGRGTPLPLASPRQLVIRGPYQYLRNPMAVAGIGQGVAVGLWRGSWAVLAYAAAGAVLWHLVIRPAEEHDLAARFGQPYEDYRRRVPLWYPRLSRYQPPAQVMPDPAAR